MKTFRQILGEIKKGEFSPVYILMGEEPYFLDRLTDALEENVVAPEDRDFDQAILFGADIEAGNVIEIANRFPFMSSRQLVVLKESQSMQQAKNQLDKLSAYIENPVNSTILAIVYKGEKLASSSQLIKAANKNKAVTVFDSPKIRDYQLAPYIKDYCTEVGATIEDKALNLLIDHVGTSLTKLFSEIDKLIVADKKGEKRITSALIEENIGISKDFNNFELTAALARRDYFSAMRIIKYFADNPKTNPTVVTTGVLFTFFQKLLLAHFNGDKSDGALMTLFQMKSAYALKDIKAGISSYSPAQTIEAIHLIREFDTFSKGIDSFQPEFGLLRDLMFKLLTLR